MKNTFAFSGFKKDKATGAYPLPILLQGSPILTVLSGQVGEQTFQTTTGRGDVYAIDVLQSQPVNAFGAGIGGAVTLVAGGQSLFEGVSTDSFAVIASPDTHARTFTPVEIAQAQTVRLIANQIATTAGTRATLQTLLYYTNEQQAEFVKNYRRLSGLGQKRTANRLRVNAGVGAGVVNLVGTVPRNLGDINAVQVQIGGVGMTNVDLLDGFYAVDVIINGAVIIENVNPVYFQIPSFKRPQIFPVYIEAGSTFELRVSYTGVLTPLDTDFYLTFYYAN